MASISRHLFLPLLRGSPPRAISVHLDDLAEAHDFVANAAFQHRPPLMSSTWGADVKRSLVVLSGPHLGAPPPLVGVEQQALAEIVNQLATVERLLDALQWAVGEGMQDVEECHPSTSHSPGHCSHDLVVGDRAGGRMVFEVSDVAGPNGNANTKMDEDLTTLRRCTCGGGAASRPLLAVSDSSAAWLGRRRGLGPGVRCGRGTWIVDVGGPTGAPAATVPTP